MALSIAVSVGSRITVGGHLLHVKAARPNEMIVTVDGAQDVVVGTDTRAEILPDVYAFVGSGPAPGAPRLALEAAGAIHIERLQAPTM